MRIALMLCGGLVCLAAGYWLGQSGSIEPPADLEQPFGVEPTQVARVSEREPKATRPSLKVSDQQRVNRLILEGGFEALERIYTDPEFADMRPYAKRLVIVVYPELLLQHEALDQLLAITRNDKWGAIHMLALQDADLARTLAERWFSEGQLPSALQVISNAQVEAASEQSGDPRAMVEAALRKESRDERIRELYPALSTLSEIDPAAAAALFLEIPAGEREPFLQLVVSAWAERDLPAAANWVLAREPGERREALGPLGHAWASKDLHGASVFVDQLSGRDRIGWLNQLASHVARKDPGGVETWIATYTTGSDALAVVPAAADRLARNDPERAFALIETLPEKQQGAAMMRILPTLAATQPAEAIAQLDNLAPGRMRNQIEKIVVSMSSRGAYEAASEYVMQLEASPRRDQLIGTLIGGRAQTDPLQAIELLDEIQSERQKRRSGYTLMFSLDDDRVARRLGRELGLTPEQVEEVLNSRGLDGGFIGGVPSFLLEEGRSD